MRQPREIRYTAGKQVGSARGLVDANGVVTDTYEMDAFGRSH
jgi:hypothetical protein